MKFTEWAELRNDEEENMPDARQFKYLACILHTASQKELIRAGQRFVLENTGSLISPHWVGSAHHMVVKSHPTISTMKSFKAKFGKPVMLTVEAFAHDARCLAAIIKSPLPTPGIPHVVIAHSPEVQSNYANDMIKDRSLWKRFLEIDDLYTYLLGVRHDESVWPTTVSQLASVSPLVK